MNFLKKYFTKLNSPVVSLQFIQLFRFTTLFLISIAFAKSNYSVKEIGLYEKFIYFAGALSFFWTNGLIQSLLGQYHTFKDKTEQSKYLFNNILVSIGFSFLILIVIASFERPMCLFFINNQSIPFKYLFLTYLLLSPITFFIEYIYLLNNKLVKIYSYGIISYVIQLLFVVIPSFIYNDLAYSLWGLIIVVIIRLLWLLRVMLQFTRFEYSWEHIKHIVKYSRPLILGAFIAGSIPYIDGILVSMHFDDIVFAVFRYGARELPISVLLASAFSNAMIPVLNASENFTDGLKQLKKQALQLMHLLFPLSIALLLVSFYLFKYVFNPNFIESAHIFNVMLLLIIPRMLFPQTILMAKGQNSYLLLSSILEFMIKLIMSIWLLSIMGLLGIAFATLIAFIFEKVMLMYFVKKQNDILPQQYTYLGWYFFYSGLIIVVYFLVEKVISYN
ncbi:MAG: hypothetical protein Fur0028_11590 [Bacteroidales bacterium]